MSAMEFQFACYFEDPDGYYLRVPKPEFKRRPFFCRPSDRPLIAKAAGRKSPPQLSELTRTIVRGYRFRTKKNDNSVVLVGDKNGDGSTGDGVASGYVYYFGSIKEEMEFELLMGKDFAMSGWNIEFMDGHLEPGVVCTYEGCEEELGDFVDG